MMNFTQFSALREQLLASEHAPLDAAETRVVRALGQLRTPEVSPTSLHLPAHAHRCHLAEFWLEYVNLPTTLKPRCLIAQGVRDSLQHLFRYWASIGKRALLPQDVYPAYLQLAQDAQLHYRTYPLWPALDAKHLQEVDVILLCNPAKPRASALSETEINLLLDWLAQDANRRVVLDAVYDFGPTLHASNMRLFASEQAIILHSLSKAWLQPLVLGVALIPQADIAALTPLFRATSPTQPNLQLAQALLTQDLAFPASLLQTLACKRAALQSALQARGCHLPLLANVPSYLFMLPVPFDVLLQEYRVLALPFSVFGGDARQSVVSSLRC